MVLMLWLVVWLVSMVLSRLGMLGWLSDGLVVVCVCLVIRLLLFLRNWIFCVFFSGMNSIGLLVEEVVCWVRLIML